MGCRNLLCSVKPSGSDWTSLDDLILPHFATAVTAEVHGDTACSDWLSLERSGCVPLRKQGVLVELLSPMVSHKLLLVAAPLRVHNQTDLALFIRFHDAKRQVLQLELPPGLKGFGLETWP